MEIIISGRQAGKTTALIRKCHETGGRIVCASMKRVRHIASLAEEMGLVIPHPITFGELIDGCVIQGWGIPCFYIDDVDSLLRQLTRGVPIEALTITGTLVGANEAPMTPGVSQVNEQGTGGLRAIFEEG